MSFDAETLLRSVADDIYALRAELEQWKRLALERQAKLDEYNFSVHSPKRLLEENEQLRERLKSAEEALKLWRSRWGERGSYE